MRHYAVISFLLTIVVGLSFAELGHAAVNKRVALIIGNSNHQHAVKLANPADDARLMSATLKRSGFEVVEGVDLGYAAMRDAINRFTESAYDADVALIYYAGHGMQVAGKNYLVPIDAELTAAAHLKTRTLQIDDFLAALPPDPAVGIVILDACRDNPLSRTMAGFFPQSRSNSLVGLAPIDIKPADVGTGGILIAYATDPGAVAYDGKGANSPYTTALVKHLAEPGVEIQSALTRVRSDVAAETTGRQRPWHNASLGREVFLGGEKPVAPVAQAPVDGTLLPAPADGPTPWEIEQRVWDDASRRNTIAHYDHYLKQFPNGTFAPLAKLNIEQLKSDTVATAPVEALRSTTEQSEPVAPGHAATAPPVTPPRTNVGTELSEAAIGLRHEDRVDLQLRLKALGYDVGRIDGSFGSGTRRVIGEWQAANGFERTTFLTLAQRDSLVTATESLMEEARKQQATEEAKPAAPVATAPSVARKDPPRRVERKVERRVSKPNRPVARSVDRPRGKARFKTCSNLAGSFQVPVDQACSSPGATTQYQAPPKRGQRIAPPKAARKAAPNGKWKTCNNVWGSYQVRSNQRCSSNAGS